jgi:cytochrome c
VERVVEVIMSRTPNNMSSLTRYFNSAFIYLAGVVVILGGCKDSGTKSVRPLDPWAFRSVLDKKPRMLTLAFDTSLYAAYDLQSCSLYKVWKGGVLMEGAPYTDKKNVQPTSWGTTYEVDTTGIAKWTVEVDGQSLTPNVIHKGHYFKGDEIHLKYMMILPTGDTLYVDENPAFVRINGLPGIKRSFKVTAPEDRSIAIKHSSAGEIIDLKPNESTSHTRHFAEPPKQSPPKLEASYDHRGRYWMEKSDCLTCHELDRNTVGPSFEQVAAKYPREKTAIEYLIRKIREGGSGVWGATPMNAHPNLGDREVREMVNYILSLRPAEPRPASLTSSKSSNERGRGNERKPGFGAPLKGVHPSYTLENIRPANFKPKTGGLAFLPDGGLLVTTWDVVGGVYLLRGVETGDTTRITVKRIASGLSEPLGIEVVDGEIYVLQKHELTRLRDLNNDEIIDAYESVCNSWGVTADFHEFAFGLIYKDGYFYATLSLAMRLMSGERQQFDRGRTIRISKDGTYEWINYGLRTPNGIGIGVDGEIFVTDNQGEWTPANKLIHVKQGEYHGMYWGLPEGIEEIPEISPPAIWLPEDEIGNSPSEPVLIHQGPYKGQMLHGDVTHGGIKRDFLEKVNGQYQGCVFRFSQGLEAGVNRMRWGPDSALYVGGVGMVGGWSWKENQYGLQKLKFNGKVTFEMLAVRAQPNGFEIELTEALTDNQTLSPSEFLIQQWRYEGTSAYGGPKLDLTNLKITDLKVSPDRKRIFLEIEGLKERHVVYIVIPDTLRSESGQSLWSNETWYTLNAIPSTK